MQRREFLTGAMGAAWAQAAPTVPPYLKAYAKLYAKDPHAAAMEWFENARFGLFMH